MNAGFERSSLGLRWLVSLSTAARGHAASAPSLPCGADGKGQPVLVQRRSFEQKEEELAHRLHCPQGKGPPAEGGGWRGWQQGQSALRALLRLLLPVSPFSFLGGLLLLFASPTAWKSKNPYQSFLPLSKLEIRASSRTIYRPKQILPNRQELRKRLRFLPVGCGGLPSQSLEGNTPVFYGPKGWHKYEAI